MALLFISDIHGSHKRLQEVFDTPYPFDMVALVGDLMYHGPRNPILDDYNPQGVADILNSVKKPIVAVRGNCDSEVDQLLLNFPMMQDYTTFPFNQTSIYLTHGHLCDPLVDGPKKSVRLFVSGHTHVPIMELIEDTLIYNPGSIALPKEGHPNTYGILEGMTLTTYTLNHEVYMQFEL